MINDELVLWESRIKNINRSWVRGGGSRHHFSRIESGDKLSLNRLKLFFVRRTRTTWWGMQIIMKGTIFSHINTYININIQIADILYNQRTKWIEPILVNITRTAAHSLKSKRKREKKTGMRGLRRSLHKFLSLFNPMSKKSESEKLSKNSNDCVTTSDK